jgi:hypothetical protein
MTFNPTNNFDNQVGLSIISKRKSQDLNDISESIEIEINEIDIIDSARTTTSK